MSPDRKDKQVDMSVGAVISVQMTCVVRDPHTGGGLRPCRGQPDWLCGGERDRPLLHRQGGPGLLPRHRPRPGVSDPSRGGLSHLLRHGVRPHGGEGETTGSDGGDI